MADARARRCRKQHMRLALGSVLARGAAARAPLAVRYASRTHGGSEVGRPRQRSSDVFSLFDDLFASSPLASMTFPRDAFPIDVHETKDAFVVKGDLPGFQTKGVRFHRPLPD